MSPYYLKPHYPIAKLVADQVRAFDPEINWVVVGFFDFCGEIEPMTVRATDLKDLQPGEVGMIVRPATGWPSTTPSGRRIGTMASRPTPTWSRTAISTRRITGESHRCSEVRIRERYGMGGALAPPPQHQRISWGWIEGAPGM